MELLAIIWIMLAFALYFKRCRCIYCLGTKVPAAYYDSDTEWVASKKKVCHNGGCTNYGWNKSCQYCLRDLVRAVPFTGEWQCSNKKCEYYGKNLRFVPYKPFQSTPNTPQNIIQSSEEYAAYCKSRNWPHAPCDKCLFKRTDGMLYCGLPCDCHIKGDNPSFAAKKE